MHESWLLGAGVDEGLWCTSTRESVEKDARYLRFKSGLKNEALSVVAAGVGLIWVILHRKLPV